MHYYYDYCYTNIDSLDNRIIDIIDNEIVSFKGKNIIKVHVLNG